jgi:hypothetical protein
LLAEQQGFKPEPSPKSKNGTDFMLELNGLDARPTQPQVQYVLPLKWSLYFALTPKQWRGLKDKYRTVNPNWRQCSCPKGCRATTFDERWEYDHGAKVKRFAGASFICRGQESAREDLHDRPEFSSVKGETTIQVPAASAPVGSKALPPVGPARSIKPVSRSGVRSLPGSAFAGVAAGKLNYDRSIRDYKKAICLAPKDAGGYDLLAWVLATSWRTGCRDAQILEHLRGPRPHVRGCWVVDAVLGKG